MNAITIGINPIALSWGSFELRWYSLIIMVAVIVAVFLGAREAERRGLGREVVLSGAPWVVLGGIVGARLVHVIDQIGYYAANPQYIFAFGQGGLAIYGAVMGGGLVAVWHARRKGVGGWALADTLTPAVIVAMAIGRIGCLINGDAVGSPTSLPWGTAYTHPAAIVPQLGVAYHPAEIYEMLWDLVVLGVVLKARSRMRADGALFLLFASLYSVGRFFITFWRINDPFLLGMKQAQFIALLVVLVAVPLMFYLLRRRAVAA